MIIQAGAYLLENSFPATVALNTYLLGQHNINFSSHGVDFIGLDFNSANMSVYYIDSDNDHYLAGKINYDLTINIDNRYKVLQFSQDQEDSYGAIYYLLQSYSTLINNCKNNQNYIVSGETLLNTYLMLDKYTYEDGGLVPSKIKDLPDTIETVCKQQLSPYSLAYDSGYMPAVTPDAVCEITYSHPTSWPLAVTVYNNTDKAVDVWLEVYRAELFYDEEAGGVSTGEWELIQEEYLMNLEGLGDASIETNVPQGGGIGFVRLKGVRYV